MGTCYGQLSPEERYEIGHLHRTGLSHSVIGLKLGRSRQTIWRELRRNAQQGGWYCPIYADRLCRKRRQHDSRFKLARQPALRKHVETRLAMGWSPEQIAGRLAREDNGLSISHESIYRYIHRPGSQTPSWQPYLIRKRSKRGWRKRRSIEERIAHRVSIEHRSQAANNRSELGHWEADFMSFTKKGPSILILTDRMSRYTKLCLKDNKHAGPVAQTIYDLMRRERKINRRSITFDNGSEFFQHMFLKHRLRLETYFCDTHSPWQKGTVENTIGRLRRRWPLKYDISKLNDEVVSNAEKRLNNTPRKCLGYKTPKEVYLQNIKNVALQM